MSKSNSSKRLRVEEYQVTSASRPGWVWGTSRALSVGEQVYCAGGVGTVSSVRGKTGDGSRLLQIELEAEQQTAPFFAAASNVLVLPSRK